MEPTPKDRMVRTVIIVGGALFVLAMTYGSGMRAQVKKIQDLNEVRKKSEQDYRDAQRKMRVRLATVKQLEARRQVSLALNELDRRNFGSAADHIKTAAQLLQEVQTANTANPDLGHVLSELQQVNPLASVNVGGERDTLTSIATEIDTSLSDFVSNFIRDSTADDTAHPIVAPTMNDVPLPPGNQIKD
jgi:hypothetical protein